MFGGAEKSGQGVLLIDRVRTIDMDRLSGQVFEQVVEPLCVCAFLISSVAEDLRDREHSFFLCAFRRNCVAVARLAFAGKSSHQIFFCHTFRKVNSHGTHSFFTGKYVPWLQKICMIDFN